MDIRSKIDQRGEGTHRGMQERKAGGGRQLSVPLRGPCVPDGHMAWTCPCHIWRLPQNPLGHLKGRYPLSSYIVIWQVGVL